ncbi:hypothetical protein RJ641_000469 [Dillenia turbinata]|uniref:Uncharacterized protein n=1 Tax=Dillenia turbinata TaxID=194707 RepID=A0AAN8ZR40_9MAGN
MEGVGSRLGRASSRYGSTAVFTGPVRKWKKKWVNISSSSTFNNNLQSSNNNSNNGSASTIFLCKWTPLSNGDGDNGSTKESDPPRKKFRYTPIAFLEEQKEAAKRAEDDFKMNEIKKSAANVASKTDISEEKRQNNDFKMEEIQNSNKIPLASHELKQTYLDLGLCLKGQDESNDSDDQEKESPQEKPVAEDSSKIMAILF